jgi:hypothetical protein
MTGVVIASLSRAHFLILPPPRWAKTGMGVTISPSPQSSSFDRLRIPSFIEGPSREGKIKETV